MLENEMMNLVTENLGEVVDDLLCVTVALVNDMLDIVWIDEQLDHDFILVALADAHCRHGLAVIDGGQLRKHVSVEAVRAKQIHPKVRDEFLDINHS